MNKRQDFNRMATEVNNEQITLWKDVILQKIEEEANRGQFSAKFDHRSPYVVASVALILMEEHDLSVTIYDNQLGFYVYWD